MAPTSGPPGLGGGPPGLGNAEAVGAANSEAAAGASTGDLRAEILQRISGQVQQLITQARKDSEMKVRTELKVLNDIITDMDTRLDDLGAQLTQLEDGEQKQIVEQHTVAQALSKVEQQWGKELGKLKQELHQTIFAHNHNADLMKHQKDTLDSIRNELQMQRPEGQAERVKAQLAKVDQLLKSQQRQRKLEPLFHRLAAIEQKIAWRFPMAGMMPPMSGMPPAMAAGLAAQQNQLAMGANQARAAGGQNAQRRQGGAHGPSGGNANSTTVAAAAAAAAAAEPLGPQASEGPPKRTGGDKPAYRCPTDEEVQARLAKAAAKLPAKDQSADESDKKPAVTAKEEVDAPAEKTSSAEKEEA